MRRRTKASTAGSTQRKQGSGARALAVGSLLAPMVTCLLLSAGPVQAAPPVTLATLGKGAGKVETPVGTAVHQASGDFYVADRSNFRIDKFDSDGNFLLAWGFGVADGVTAALQTCGPQATPPRDRCFGPNMQSNNSAGNILPVAVGVDQASGDVYVADATKRRITKFTSFGEFVFLVGKNVNATKVAEVGATQVEKNICTAASGNTCTIGASGTGANEFTTPRSLAVTPSGVVWVGDTNRLKSFSSTGAPGTEIALAGAGDTRSLAINSAGDFYVRSASLAGIRKLEAGTGALLETLEGANNPRTVTVDAADNVYIGHCVTTSFNCASDPYRFTVFNPAGEKVSQFGVGQVLGTPGSTNQGANALAIGESAAALYVASSESADKSFVQRFPIPEPGPLVENQRAEDVLPSTATLAASLNPEGDETTYHFEYGTDDSYGQSTPQVTLPSSGFNAETVEAPLSELSPGTTYHFRLVASSECEPSTQCENAGPDTTFTTRPAVGIEAQWATDVAATSAALHAELDPLGVAGSWWLEYGTAPCSGGGCEQTAKAALPATFGAIEVGAVLTGLAPGTTYHYRFAAEDERDGDIHIVHGEDRGFTTQLTALGFALPDERVWEMVTPPNKFGGVLWAADEGTIQAAESGNALTYITRNSIEANPEGSRSPENGSALARRGAPGEWGSTDLAPPNAGVDPVTVGVTTGKGLEYKLFSDDLSSALLEPRAAPLLSPEASERTPYLRSNTNPPAYTPLVTGKEGFANVAEGTEFGNTPLEPEVPFSAVRIRGASVAFDRILLKSFVPLLEGDAPDALYERVMGVPPAQQIRRVSVLPGGETAVAADVGSEARSTRHAISADGSRVFWSTIGGGEPNALYVRDMNRAETTRLDVVQPGGFGTGGARPVFQGADSAGTVAFFTDTRNLTADASEGALTRDLYRCEVTLEATELGCELTNVTGQTASPTENADVQGIVAGMSDDATRVYFVAGGVLDTEPNDEGQSAVSGQPNLYLWQEGEGVRFVAVLGAEDSHDWGFHPGANPESAAIWQNAAASPSGRYLAFMSQRSLTGYDNREASSGEPAQEVFRYDAAADELVCASCNPGGSRPIGLTGGGGALGSLSFFDPQDLWREPLWDGRPLAATLPEATRFDLNDTRISPYRPRAIHDNGRLFFNAADSLVAADTNGDWDVYQYEPTGTGSCSASSGGASVALSAGGCVALISSGVAEEEAVFLDASVGGNDVFFYTPAQLSVTDEDQVYDVYDARVGGTAATLVPRAECLGEACQPAYSPPEDQTPASSLFQGAGNLRQSSAKRCPKGKRRATRKGKVRCVARKRKRANHNRRASR